MITFESSSTTTPAEIFARATIHKHQHSSFEVEDPSALDSALEYAQQGWLVFPADISGPQKKSRKSAEFSGGRPWGATIDFDEIKCDFRRWPDTVGVVTGSKSGFFVVEADTKEGHDIDGLASLAALEAKHGALPETREAESPTGSVHKYFRHPGPNFKIKNSASALARGVDIRGDGGMVIAPPSLRPGKGLYRWRNDLPVADPPQWLLDQVIEKPPEPRSALSNRSNGTGGFGRAYVAAAVDDEIKAVSNALKGCRNQQLNNSTFNLAQLVGAGALTDGEVEGEIIQASIKNGSWQEDKSEVLHTITSAMKAGKADPRQPPDGNGHDRGSAKPEPTRLPVTDVSGVSDAGGERGEDYGRKIADAIEALLARFISYPDHHCRAAHTLWIMHTHIVVKHFDSTPRLAFLSPEPASGKTRALEITERLVPNPVPAVNVSPAYLFRKVGAGNTTILFDEIDTVFGPKAKENEEIRGLLNAGHRKGAVAGRCVVKGKIIETEEIPAFAPVALAGLGWLPDTILSRSVVIRMQRRTAGEAVEPYRRRIHDAVTDPVRSMIERWAESVWPNGMVWPELPKEIQDRDADVWEPLIAIADAVGGDWPAKARDASVTLVTASKETEPSLGIRLLADLRVVFANHKHLPTGTILQQLIAMDEAPWGDLHGKPLNSRGLAQKLRPYGVKPERWRDGAIVERGYTREALAQPWKRYLPQPPEESVTTVTTVTKDGAEDVICVQCGGGASTDPPTDPPGKMIVNGKTVWLHPECRRFYEGRR